MWIFQKLANGIRLASINAVEVHSKQTSTDLNATQKHANGLRLPALNNRTVSQDKLLLVSMDTEAHVIIVANDEWFTVKFTPDLETNWPVVFQ